MNVDPVRHIRQGDNIDVVCWRLGSRLDSRRLDETRETFAIALGTLINPIADGDGRTSVRVIGVDIASNHAGVVDVKLVPGE